MDATSTRMMKNAKAAAMVPLAAMISLIVLIASPFAMMAALAQGGGPGSGSGGMTDPAMVKAMECNMFSVMNGTSSGFAGQHVALQLHERTMANVSLGESGARVFDSIEFDAGAQEGSGVAASIGMVNFSGLKVKAHNSPGAPMEFAASGSVQSRINFSLAAGMTATVISENETIEISGVGFKATISACNCVMTQNGSMIEFKFNGSGSSACFKAQVQTSSAIRNRIHEMAREGIIAGEMDLVVADGSALGDSFCYANHVSMQIASAQAGQLKVKVSAQYAEGKIFRISSDSASCKASTADGLKAMIDGAEAEKLSLGDIENRAMAGGSGAAYCIEKTASGYDVLVYVPHFSEHEISIEEAAAASSEESSNPLPAPFMAVAAVATAAIAGLGVASRRRA